MTSFLRRNGLYLSWLVACIATLGSVYYGEIQGSEPCTLCWYVRICTFPLTLLLAIALWRGSQTIVPYVLPLAILGLGFSVYLVLLQQFPDAHLWQFCGGSNCSSVAEIGMGPITMPILSTAASLVIVLLLCCSLTKNRSEQR